MQKVKVWFFAAVLVLVASGASARLAAYRDGDGKWQTIDTAKWPRVPADSPGRSSIRLASGVTFNIVYKDVVQQTGAGFDDPSQGATRRATVQEVLTYLNQVLDETNSCDIEFAVSQADGTGPLGTGGCYYFSDMTFTPGTAFMHIITGQDPDPFTPDIVVTMDFGHPWNSGMGNPAYNQSDLYSVLLHEVAHGLGIASQIGSTGASDIFANVYTTFDELLYNGAGTRLLNSQGQFQASTSDLISNSVNFRGTLASAVYGGPVPVYSPNPWSGSSMSHWANNISPEPVMDPSITNGTTKRNFQPFEIGTLVDLGYHIQGGPGLNAVPNWQHYQ